MILKTVSRLSFGPVVERVIQNLLKTDPEPHPEPT